MNKKEFLEKWSRADKTDPIQANFIWITMGDDLDELVHSAMEKEEEKPLNPLQKFLNYWMGRLYDRIQYKELSGQTHELVEWAKKEGMRQYVKQKLEEAKEKNMTCAVKTDENGHVKQECKDQTWIPRAQLRWIKNSFGGMHLQQKWSCMVYPSIEDEWRDVEIENQ